MTSINNAAIRVVAAVALVIGSLSPGGACAQKMEPLRLLFIGNSATYYHDMPKLVASMMGQATSAGASFEQVAWDGSTLENHWLLGQALRSIRKGGWHYVVLQEQTQRPIRDRAAMIEYIKKFDAEIRAVGAKTVLFGTWARRASPETQPIIDEAYALAARDTGALLAPVGAAWRDARRRRPQLELYEDDGSHPRFAGTYLAACVLFITIRREANQCPVVTGMDLTEGDVEALSASARAIAARAD